MRSFALLSLLSLAANVTAAGKHANGVRHDRGLAKRLKEDHNAITSWNHEKRQADNARMTWFYPGMGACGHQNVDSDYVRPKLLSVG